MDTNGEDQHVLDDFQKAVDKINKSDEIKEKLLIYIKQFRSESDRACILLTASMIDYRLKELLGKFLVPPTNKKDDILSEKGMNPLGTLSSRHKIAYRLGIISPKMEKTISNIRDIRNSCAHKIEFIDFEDRSNPINESLNAKIDNLVLQFGGMRNIFAQHQKKKREQFLFAASWIIVKLDYIILDVSPLKMAKTENIFSSKVISKWGNSLA